MKVVWFSFVFLFVVGLFAATSQSQSANITNTSSQVGSIISGRVTKHGKGLSDVVVKAWPQPSSQPPPDNLLEAKTDFEGYYRITSLPPANYYVGAYGHGLVPVQKGAVSESPQSVSVSAGETVSGIDFQLVGGGVITGRITDGEGRPVIEAPVMLTELTPQPNPTLSFPNPATSAFSSGLFKTDDRGIYRVFGIPPGSYKLSAGARFTAFSSFRGRPAYRRTFYAGTTEPARARAIEVGEEAVLANIDINVGSIVPAFSVSGQIVDNQTKQSVPNVTFDIHIAGGADGSGVIPQAGTSDSNGEFKLENLPAGRYSVKISEARAGTATKVNGFFGESPQFEIRDSEVRGIEVRAMKTSGVSGMVVVENTSDRTILSRASQLSLLFEVNPGAGVPMAFQTAKPESDGSFSVSGLKPGRLRISLNSQEQGVSMGLRFQRMELGSSTPVREIAIVEGQPVAGLRVILVYGSGSVRGFVKLENGSLPADVRLSARVTNDKGFYAGGWADNRGGFLIEALPAGNYTLTVSAEVPGKRTLGPETHQPILVSEGAVAQTTIVLDLTALRTAAP